MKIRIEEQPDLAEDEIIIRCAQVNQRIRQLHQSILDQTLACPQIVFYKEDSEYYFPLSNVLFFETEGDTVYAHTAKDSYKTKNRLYELEKTLPRKFIRVSKSTILNAELVHAITKNLASSSRVEFLGTHKNVYVSRRYYNHLKQKLNERNNLL